MSNKKNNSPHRNKDKVMQLDSILKEKYDKDRLAEWKKLMPMPEEISAPQTKNLKKPLALILALGLGIGMLLFFSTTSSDPINLADTYLQSTTIALLEDQNARGEGQVENSAEVTEFYLAVTELKANKNTEAVQAILNKMSLTKSQYQIEALWLSALAHIKAGNTTEAINKLNKLTALSSYKREAAIHLLENLNK